MPDASASQAQTPFNAELTGETLARDRGLVRGIGTLGLAANVVNGVVGAGIFTLPASVALAAGGAAPAAYVLCAIAMAGVVICFAEAGSRVPTSGGAYGTVEAALGPMAGFVTGILLLVSDVLASGGIAAALADMIGAVLPPLATGSGRFVIILAEFGLATAANLIGVHRTVRIITGATAIKMLPLLLFLLLGLLSIGMAAPTGPAAPPVTIAGFCRGLILTCFAFSGMETALCVSGEVRHAARTVPRGLGLGMLWILGLYITVQLSAQHLLGTDLPHSAAPLADGAARFGALPRIIMIGGASLSMMAWMASDVLGTSRLLFAFGRDGRLPAWFGVLGARTHVPVRAILSYVAIAFMLAVTGTFLELIVLSTLAVVGIYGLTCLAALRLRQRGVALAGPPLGFAGLPVAAAVGLLGMAGILFSAAWQEVAGLVAVIALSLLLYGAMRAGIRRRTTGSPP